MVGDLVMPVDAGLRLVEQSGERLRLGSTTDVVWLRRFLRAVSELSIGGRCLCAGVAVTVFLCQDSAR
jgi:hypothetical protein